MAMLDLHRTQQNYAALIETGIDDNDTSVIVGSIESQETFAIPSWLTCGNECLEVTSYTDATPLAGQATLVIARGANGTTPAAHSAGATIAATINDWELAEVQDRLNGSQAIVGADAAASGVQRTDTGDDLAVVAAAVPDMTVIIGAGAGVVEGQPVYAATDTLEFTGPVSNPRIDLVVISQYNTFEVVTGDEGAVPVAPATPGSRMLLAQVYHRVGEAHIDDVSDGLNGYITDRRSFI